MGGSPYDVVIPGVMLRRSPTLVRLVMCVGLCAWLFGSFASGLHALLVRHVVCEEHGQLVELDHHQAQAATEPSDDAVTVTAAAGHDSHDHGCTDELTDRSGLAQAHGVAAVGRRIKRSVEPLRGAEAPRGPPLAYAPKTSPPVVA